MKSRAMPAPDTRLVEKPATDAEGFVRLDIVFVVAVQLERALELRLVHLCKGRELFECSHRA
jgi:hypothetical protein